MEMDSGMIAEGSSDEQLTSTGEDSELVESRSSQSPSVARLFIKDGDTTAWMLWLHHCTAPIDHPALRVINALIQHTHRLLSVVHLSCSCVDGEVMTTDRQTPHWYH